MPVPPTAPERIHAYRHAMDCLSCRQWAGAIGRRTDGSSVAGVFNVLQALRIECQARIGDLAEQGSVDERIRVREHNLDATSQDIVTALEIAVSQLSTVHAWGKEAGMSEAGLSADGIGAALGEIRRNLHECIGVAQRHVS